MKKLLTFAYIASVGFSSLGQYCTIGVGPTSTADGDLGVITLNGETMNISTTNTCPGVLGVEDFTIQSADLMADSSYILNFENSTCGGNFTNRIEAWIDYNNDQTFSAVEVLGTFSGTATSNQSFNFTVPAWVCDDTVRMRVMLRENGTSGMDPCGSFTWGSVADFTITLSGGSCMVAGCMDTLASNYSPSAVVDDGSCVYIMGCMDPTASNYDSNAVVDDGSCFWLPGCTDTAAYNYNPNAVIDDGSCVYTADSGDCVGAILICQDYQGQDFYDSNEDPNLNGSVPDEVPNSSCLSSGERNAVWYTFTSYQDGDLGFTILPTNPDDDYDWAVYDISDNGCEGIPLETSPELSCNYAPNVCPPPDGDGGTGPNGDLTGPCAGQNEPLIQVDSGGVYVIVVSQFTASSEDGYSIIFDSSSVIYNAQLETKDMKMCFGGDSIVLGVESYTGQGAGSEIYNWYSEDLTWSATGPEPVVYNLDTTTKFVVEVQSQDCIITDTVTVELSGVTANFGWEYEDNGFPVIVSFIDSSLVADELTWFFADSSAPLQTDAGIIVDHEYQLAGLYPVMQVAKDSDLGCVDTITKLVDLPYLLPNIITPNDDGINDYLFFKGVGGQAALYVYNRLGREVYKKDLEYNEQEWDGGNLPDGTYYYVIIEPGTDNKTHKSTLQIIR